MNRTIVRTGIAAAAALGVSLAGASLWAGTASAMPAEGCNADQLVTTVVHGSPGAGQRYAEVQFTAKAHQYCQLKGNLPVTITGARNVLVTPDTFSPATVVHLRPGSSAHVLLHWTGIADAAQQETPNSITVRTPGDRGQHVTLPWNEGSVDASPESHSIDVGVVQAGPADQ
ncbi:MAG: hypothetical protein JWQ81_2737 [Amycolatopsis sp.]|jgi:hypothetical protein|uniref:DUF4232 domain-containing protein n=1 Tax=Amycolatopsis sp. TaxID=37632 RepID=UPI002634D42C|nr:DUF4232 domain-containing protein [Amycolatopsis sp.]MCU1681998.1 hypothetical protein [Amycolatopsis sp.]